MKFICDVTVMSDDEMDAMDPALVALVMDLVNDGFKPFPLFYSVDRDKGYYIARSLESLYYTFYVDRENVTLCDGCGCVLSGKERGHGCKLFLDTGLDNGELIEKISEICPKVRDEGFTGAYYSNPVVRRNLDELFRSFWKPVLCDNCKRIWLNRQMSGTRL